MVKGRPTKSGKTVVWDRYGDDCAYILRNLSIADGFKSWGAFQKDSAFPNFLNKYSKDNLKRNFDKTVTRYGDWIKEGAGGFKNKMLANFIFSTYLMISFFLLR
jgi:hypothetical protein